MVKNKSLLLGCFVLLSIVGVNCIEQHEKHVGIRTTRLRPSCRFNADFPENICPVWTYEQAKEWGKQCPAWETCSLGKSQSPIDVSEFSLVKNGGNPLSLDMMYSPSRVNLFNNARNVFATVPDYTGIFGWGSDIYNLKSIEFKTPSEHTIRGKRYPLELQFIHEADGGKKANVAVMVTEGAYNDVLGRFFPDLPQQSMCSCGNGIIETFMGEECDDGDHNSDTERGACRTNCRFASCGDGVLDAGEECDFGPQNDANKPNFCRPNCRLPYCGDRVVDPNHMVLDLSRLDGNLVPIPQKIGFEQCDDGNIKNGDGCNEFCQYECGNGVTDEREDCDDGPLNSNMSFAACRPDCSFPRCGDGVVNDDEECDEGLLVNLPDRCRANCALPRCGDNVTDLWLGEECDAPKEEGCDSTCRLMCGNGIIEPGEECDEGSENTDSASGTCRSNCRLPYCGDGIVDMLNINLLNPGFQRNPEQCDDGSLNGIAGGRCSNQCTIACGNGKSDPGESCDYGQENSDTLPNACRTNCHWFKCGDGVVDQGEECDLADTTYCRACKIPICGDGITDAYRGEECDDGNHIAGDGCSPTCLAECGNGIKDAANALEECDMGKLNSDVRPDACRSDCSLARCGDGVTDSNEECDDGLDNDNNRPNACRGDCRLPYCGDSVVDDAYGEFCDKGAHTLSPNRDDEIDGCSTRCTPNRCAQSIPENVVNWQDLIPCPATGFFHYSGSLTNPPCTEGVDWFVLEKFVTLSADQLRALQTIYNQTARATQPLNFRYVRYPTDNPALCGNGALESGEECDDPKGNSDTIPNSCRTNCKLPHCGDGITDCSEECDGGMTCTDSCRRGTTTSGNKTVVNVFFKDLLPYNHFCCGAKKPSPERAPCTSC